MNNLKDLKISKELFEAVYNCDISTDKDILCVYKNRNIYEFAFKCKEWAKDKYDITVSSSIYKKYAKAWDISNDKSYIADTEVEAIIKACTYILNNLSNK